MYTLSVLFEVLFPFAGQGPGLITHALEVPRREWTVTKNRGLCLRSCDFGRHNP